MSEVLGAVVIGTAQAYEICCRDNGVTPRDVFAGTPWCDGRRPRIGDYVAWSDYVPVVSRVFQHTDELPARELVRIFLMGTMAMRYLTRLLTPLVSPQDLYRAVYLWLGVRLYKNMSRRCHVLPDKSVKVEIELFPGQMPCLEFFKLVEQCLVLQAHTIGCGDATLLSSECTDTGIKAHLQPPPVPSWTARAGRFFDRILGRAGTLALDVSEEIIAAHAEAQMTEQSLLTLFDQMPDGLAVLELNGLRLRYSNPALYRILGREEEELQKGTLLDFVSAEDRDKFAALLTGNAAHDLNPCWMNVKTVKGIELKPVEVRYGGQLAYKRETCRFVILRDLSTLKQLESKLSSQQRLAVLGELGAGLSHELAAPLSVAFSSFQCLLDESWPEPKAGRNLIDGALRQLEHVDTILKSYSRAAKRPQKSELQAEALERLVTEALIICQAKARQAAVKMEFDADSDIRVSCRPHAIMQAITNLVSNAIDAAMGTEGRAVKLQLKDCGAYAQLTVTDSGVITDSIVRERMMEPFFTTKDSGTGLGLTLTRQLIEEHDGRFYLDTAAPCTTFVMELRKS